MELLSGKKATTLGTKVEVESGETPWTDDRIRWEEEKKRAANANGNDDEEEEESDEEEPWDPFKPDPRETFSFEYILQEKKIDIALHGFQEESDQIYVSTGLTIWRAAEYLGHYMVDECYADYFSKPLRILELGAGLGLNGILAAKLAMCEPEPDKNGGEEPLASTTSSGKSSVIVLTDGDTNALQQLRHNVQANLEPELSTSANAPKVLVQQLLWGEQYTAEFLEKRHDNESFDVLLASDVVYVSEIIVPLFESVTALLAKPHGKFFFAYCSRRRVPVSIEQVLERATEVGLDYTLIKSHDDVHIFEMTWKGVE